MPDKSRHRGQARRPARNTLLSRDLCMTWELEESLEDTLQVLRPVLAPVERSEKQSDALLHITFGRASKDHHSECAQMGA